MDLKALLEVQKTDILIDQSLHALDHLAERSALHERQQNLAEIRSRRDDVRREQQIQQSELDGIETESSTVDTQLARLEGQLKTVIAPREAEALQHEIATLRIRRGSLDDRALELLESSAQADDLVTLLQREEDAAVAAETAARVDLERAIAVVQGSIDRLREQRAQLASHLAAADLDEYERRRRTSGGIAVAEIAKGVCGGCHMDISISELDAIKRLPDDAAPECPNCMRLLVR